MNILALIFFLSITIPGSPAIINDNQSNYSNGIIINQPNLIQDAQNNYDNGILIIKSSVLQDEEVTSTPALTSTGTSSSSGGSGGGSGASSSENFSNILQFEQHEGTLIKDKPVSFKFNLSIYEILLTGKENEYDVSVRVELLKDKPQKATTKPDGEVIQYFNVITSSRRMKEAVIRFKTNQSAELFKWNSSEWIILDMIENVEDLGLKMSKECIDNPEQQICYTYKTDPFSSFAIVKRPKIIPINTAPQGTATTIQANTSPILVQETPKQASGFTILLSIFVLLIIRKIK